MPDEASAGRAQQALESSATGSCAIGRAFCRQQGMLQFSPPAQAGATAAARINSASQRWMHLVKGDFILMNYKYITECLSTENSMRPEHRLS
jgi:hypothetical protein